MHKELDPVDRALQSLAGRQWPGDSYDLQLERTLMQSFETSSSVPACYRHRLMIPALAVVLLAGVAFVAAGGVELVRSWFVTTTFNGEVVGTQEVIPNEDGSATFNIPVGPPKDGENVIELAIEGDGVPTGGQKTVNVTLNGDDAQVEIKPSQSGDGE